ncbi:hypothetical protein ACEPAF_115 [Sanghuangporus sanghuang]
MKAKRSSVAKMRNKLSLLSLGCIQIEDAMCRLKHWLSELHHILMASPQLYPQVTHSRELISKMEQDEDEDLLFVTIAWDREEKDHPVRCIDDDLFKSARLLDLANPDLFFINGDLFFINEGQWDGCLIDRRIVEHFLEEGIADIAIKDTERMARLFAEEYDDLGHNITATIGSSRSIPLTQADREGRSVLWQALYRHPRHLCTQRHVPSETRDDIFSLGICLLKTAVWKSLFVWNEEAGVLECDKAVLDFSDEKYFMGELADCESLDRELPYCRLRDLKTFAEEMVPITMGSAFKDIVVDCLTFGEEDPRIVDMAQRQKDNVAFLKNQSINFVQRVLTKLKNLKLN